MTDALFGDTEPITLTPINAGPLLQVRAPGIPRPQGSMTHYRAGGVSYSRPTREHRGHLAGFLDDHWQGAPPIDVPVGVDIEFHFVRPAAHFKPANTRRPEPVLRPEAPTYRATFPDVDRLIRLVFDALTASGVWTDDKLAVRVTASKLYWPTNETLVTLCPA